MFSESRTTFHHVEDGNQGSSALPGSGGFNDVVFPGYKGCHWRRTAIDLLIAIKCTHNTIELNILGSKLQFKSKLQNSDSK